MTRRAHPTIGRLWARYLEVREALKGGRDPGGRMEVTEREARGLRDRLVVNYSPLVKYVAGRISARMSSVVDQEDVVSWGILGLLDAVESYDPVRRTKFESYAISKIRWSILDELRRADPLPRRVRLRAREVERCRGELAQRLGHAPTEEEVASELGVGIEEHWAFLERCSWAQVGSLEASLDPDGGAVGTLHEIVPDRSAIDPESAAEMAEVRSRLTQAIAELGERERVVTTFYFYEGLTLREIGRALDLTEGRISQILHRALRELRRTLAENPQFSGRL